MDFFLEPLIAMEHMLGKVFLVILVEVLQEIL
jgi:hypothetical protein